MTNPTPRNERGQVATDALNPWLAAQFEALRTEGQVQVDDYWIRLKTGRAGRKPYDSGTLGLRLRSRDSGAFSLEWYELGTLGRERTPIAKRHIPKGRGHQYPLRTLLRGQPKWLAPLVEEIERVLAGIRKRQALVIRIRDSVSDYAAELTQGSGNAAQLP